MADKRFKKLEALTKELEKYETVKLHGPKEADATIIGWGSTKGPIREAMKILSNEGIKVNYMQIRVSTSVSSRQSSENTGVSQKDNNCRKQQNISAVQPNTGTSTHRC